VSAYRNDNEGRDLWELGRAYLHQLRRVIECHGYFWYMAHTTADLPVPTEVVFEWWRKDRNLVVFFRRSEVEGIRVWGSNIHSEMESVWLHTPEDFIHLWRWLETGLEDKCTPRFNQPLKPRRLAMTMSWLWRLWSYFFLAT